MTVGKHLVVATVALLIGCSIDASIGRDELESNGGGDAGLLTGSDGSDTGRGSEGGAEFGGEGTQGGAEGGGSEGSTTTPTAETDHDSGSSDHGEPLLCQIHGTDSACAECRKGHCCDQILVCHEQPGCFCFWECIIEVDATPAGCSTHCEYDGLAFDELVHCQAEMCPEFCSDMVDEPPPTDG